MREEAVEACRQWAHVRVVLSGLIKDDDELREFDKQMFRLGERVFTAEGEVTAVGRLTGDDPYIERS